MSRLETVVEELKSLSPAKLEKAAGYIHQLTLSDRPEGKAALDRAFGCLTAAEADEMERAINGYKTGSTGGSTRTAP